MAVGSSFIGRVIVFHRVRIGSDAPRLSRSSSGGVGAQGLPQLIDLNCRVTIVAAFTSNVEAAFIVGYLQVHLLSGEGDAHPSYEGRDYGTIESYGEDTSTSRGTDAADDI